MCACADVKQERKIERWLRQREHIGSILKQIARLTEPANAWGMEDFARMPGMAGTEFSWDAACDTMGHSGGLRGSARPLAPRPSGAFSFSHCR